MPEPKNIDSNLVLATEPIMGPMIGNELFGNVPFTAFLAVEHAVLCLEVKSFPVQIYKCYQTSPLILISARFGVLLLLQWILLWF